MRLHLLAFPHTRVTPEYATCAYTQKVVKFLKMVRGRHDVVLYAPEGSDPQGHELVEVLTDEERVAIFGHDDKNGLPAWPDEQQCALFNARVPAEVRKRAEQGDLLLLTMGMSQKSIHDALSDLIGADRRMLALEPGVGYEGWFSNHVAFESYSWMHWLYAKREWQMQTQQTGFVQDGRFFDTVIPNYFDPADFSRPKRKGQYLLFLGRLINRKGVQYAAEIAKATGMELVMAGPGVVEHGPGYIVSSEAGRIEAPKITYAGVADAAMRGDLLAGATCLLAPTLYIEPFGGVAVEAMMAGCPVVATDWGAFTETVQPGVSGYRFRSLDEACHAVEACDDLTPELVRAWAKSRYSLEAVAPQFDRWFEQVATLWDDGWYHREAPYARTARLTAVNSAA